MDEAALLREIKELRSKLREKEANLVALRREKLIVREHGLDNKEIARYSRQMLIPEIGVKGILHLLLNNK